MENVRSLAFFLSLLFLSGCAKSLEKQIAEQVRTFEKASLGEEQVEVRNIQRSRGQAIAEVQITTAVKLSEKEGKWIIEEVRIGDRRWEKAEHILAVIGEKRSQTTVGQLELISESIRSYQQVNAQVPQVATFEELTDLLSPRFLHPLIRIDAWSNRFSYQATGTHAYDLKSAGPDGHLGTTDDLSATPFSE